jgi:hypothetical protein
MTVNLAKIIWMSSGACKKALACRQNLQADFFEKVTGFNCVYAPKIPGRNFSS